MNKSGLLNWLQEEYEQWGALLEQVGPAHMDEPGVNGQWSMKDLVAHHTGWNRRLLASFQAAQWGEPEPPPPWPAHFQDEDEINAWIYETHRGLSVRQVLDETHQVFQNLFAAVNKLPENVQIDTVNKGGHDYYLVCLGDQRVEAGEFFDHYHDQHERDVQAWLERIK